MFISIVFLFLMLIPNIAVPDSWICTEAASQRRENTFFACGIGEGLTEAEARQAALQRAYQEFSDICEPAPDCNDHEIAIEPLRNDCSRGKDGEFRCYRGVEIVLQKAMRDKSIPRPFPQSKVNVYVEKNVVEVHDGEDTPKRGIIDFQTEPSGASVEIDGALSVCETTPCSKELNYGAHKIVFKLEDYATVERTINMVSKSSVESATLAETVGHLHIEGMQSGTRVRIDNSEYALDARNIKLRPSEYVLELINEDYYPKPEKIKVIAGSTATVVFNQKRKMGFLEVSSVDENGNALAADIFIDGEKVGEKTPTKVEVPTGSHDLTLQEGERGYETKIQIEHGKSVVLKSKLEPNKDTPEMQACKNGDANECTKVGAMYLTGNGVGKSPTKAAEFFERACNLESPGGCFGAGLLYYAGQGTRKAFDLAATSFKKACDAGLPEACFRLGTMQLKGEGLEKSPTKAVGLFQGACSSGIAEACTSLGYLFITGEGVKKSADQAAKFSTKACILGSLAGCSNLGELYRDGEGFEKSPAKARGLFKKACDGGFTGGCDDLAGMENRKSN